MSVASSALPLAGPPAGPPAACLNCGASLGGAYCAACGQKAEAMRQPAHHLVRDTAVEFVGYDGRVWRTFAALAFRPGALTVAYFEGRRQRYLRPVRVYLTSTLVFFFLLSTVDPVGRIEATVASSETDTLTVAARTAETRARLAVRPDSARARMAAREDSLGTSSEQLDAGNAAAGDAAAGAVPAEVDRDLRMLRDSLRLVEDDAPASRLERQRARAELAVLGGWPPDSLVAVRDLDDAMAVLFPDSAGVTITGPAWIVQGGAIGRWRQSRTAGERRDALAALFRSAIGHVPTVMFLLLPLFALLLKALFVRRERYYAEHLVFGLHTHAYAFVVFAAMTLLAWGAPGSDAAATVSVLLLVSIPLYFVIAQKRVYGQPWGKTLFKAGLLGSAYTTALLFGLVGVVVLAAVIG